MREEVALRKEVHIKQCPFSHIQCWEDEPCSLPSLPPALPEELDCLHSLAGKHVGSGGSCWVECEAQLGLGDQPR